MDDIPTSPHCPHGDCSKPLHPFRVIITVWGFTKQTSGDYHNPFGESLSTNQYCITKWQRVLNTAYVTCETYSSTHVCLEARWQESMGRQWRYLFSQSVGLTSLKNHVFFMLGHVFLWGSAIRCAWQPDGQRVPWISGNTMEPGGTRNRCHGGPSWSHLLVDYTCVWKWVTLW